jgi:hypothetical protein
VKRVILAALEDFDSSDIARLIVRQPLAHGKRDKRLMNSEEIPDRSFGCLRGVDCWRARDWDQSVERTIEVRQLTEVTRRNPAYRMKDLPQASGIQGSRKWMAVSSRDQQIEPTSGHTDLARGLPLSRIVSGSR